MERHSQVTTAIAEAALEGTLEEYRATVLEGLRRTVGFDIGVGWSLGEPRPRPAFCGFDGSLWGRFTANAPVYQREMAPIVKEALEHGAANDHCLYGPRREELSMVRDILEPLKMFSGLTVGVAWKGRPLALFRIGRQSKRGFRPEQIRRARGLVPLLRITELGRRAMGVAPSMATRLTRREAAVLNLFAGGSSYAHVAAELGVSVNTVRTHVRHLYSKLGATSKIEALRLGLPAW